MTRALPQPEPSLATAGRGAGGDGARWLSRAAALNRPERAALFLLLVAVGVRPLVSESYRIGADSISDALDLPGGAAGVFTATMGSLVLAAGVLAEIGRRARPYALAWRGSGMLIGAVAVAAGMAVSMYVASDRRAALTASADWLTSVLAGILLVRLLRESRYVRLLLIVVATAGVTVAAKCASLRYVELPETIAQYQADREGFWRARGIPLDHEIVRMYERRLHAGEASGFFSFSNVAGSFLVMAAGAAAALAILKAKAGLVRGGLERWRAITVAVIAAGVYACVYLTGSRGALAAGALVGGLVVAWALVMRRVRLHWAARLALGWALAVLATGAVAWAALRADPYSSLGFRGEYWRNSAAMIRTDLWTGVGAENFGKFYLQYKPITSPEEVKDPHNFLVAALSQWGVLGGVGVLLLLAGWSVQVVRGGDRTARRDDAPTAESSPPKRAAADRASSRERHGTGGADIEGGMLLHWLLAIGAGITLLRLWTLLGHPGVYVYYETVTVLLVWALAAGLLAVGPDRFGAWSDAPIPRAAMLAVVAGASAFLLHALIDVSMSYPATVMTFFALAAAAVAMARLGPDAPRVVARGLAHSRSRRDAALMATVRAALFAGLFAAHSVWVWWPLARVASDVEVARQSLRAGATPDGPSIYEAIGVYRSAIDADPLDPSVAAELASWLYQIARNAPESSGVRVDELLAQGALAAQIAIERDRQDIGGYRTLASISMLAAQRTGRILPARVAVGAARSAVRLYPRSPTDLVVLADALALEGHMDARRESVNEAIRVYTQALELDAQRPGQDEVRRWSPTMRAKVVALRAEAEMLSEAAAPTTRATTTGPATSTTPVAATAPGTTTHAAGESGDGPVRPAPE